MNQLSFNDSFDIVFNCENEEIPLLGLGGGQSQYSEDSPELFTLRKNKIKMIHSDRRYFISSDAIDKFFETINLENKYTIIEKNNYYHLQFGDSSLEFCLIDQTKRIKIYLNSHIHKIFTLAKIELEPFSESDQFTFVSQKWISDKTVKKEIPPHSLIIDDTGEIMIETPTERYYVMSASFVAFNYTYSREIDEMKRDGILLSNNSDDSVSVSPSFFSLLGNSALTENFKLIDNGNKIFFKKGRMKLSLLDTYKKDSLQHKILLQLGVLFKINHQEASICKTFLSKLIYQRVQNYIDKSIIKDLVEFPLIQTTIDSQDYPSEPEIKKFEAAQRYIESNPRTGYIVEGRQAYIRDQISLREDAREEGYKKGLAQARKTTITGFIQTTEFTDQEISNATDIDIQYITDLRATI